MREIKFRAWDTEQEAMYPLISIPVSELNKRKNEIVMQYTGLTDKNGKEIYEGDIVKGNTGKTSTITFYNGSFICFDEPIGWDFDNEYPEETDPKNWAEVIGNIYETP